MNSEELSEAVKFIYTCACLDARRRNMSALKAGDMDTYNKDPSAKLANALAEVYPDIVNEVLWKDKDKSND
jgi:hypothetical protein